MNSNDKPNTLADAGVYSDSRAPFMLPSAGPFTIHLKDLYFYADVRVSLDVGGCSESVAGAPMDDAQTTTTDINLSRTPNRPEVDDVGEERRAALTTQEDIMKEPVVHTVICNQESESQEDRERIEFGLAARRLLNDSKRPHPQTRSL